MTWGISAKFRPGVEWVVEAEASADSSNDMFRPESI